MEGKMHKELKRMSQDQSVASLGQSIDAATLASASVTSTNLASASAASLATTGKKDSAKGKQGGSAHKTKPGGNISFYEMANRADGELDVIKQSLLDKVQYVTDL